MYAYEQALVIVAVVVVVVLEQISTIKAMIQKNVYTIYICI